MKTLVRPCLALLCCVFLLGSGVAWAAETPGNSGVKSSPGLDAAQAISTITGVAISPLLGVSAVGAWQWFKCAPEKRARLSWYAQPWFWLRGLMTSRVKNRRIIRLTRSHNVFYSRRPEFLWR